MNDSPVAFVAMKFDKDPWNDKRYQVMAEVLSEAGFHVVRGDEMRSSDLVISEVSKYLREADVVVIDTTGDSHNVSYELGYCHGVRKDPSSIILLRTQGEAVPFNYAHFRHLFYKDLRHLRRLLRYRLNISTPLTDEQVGFAIPFIIGEDAGFYGHNVADAVIATLGTQRYTGRCEYYAGNPILTDPNLYIIGLGLKSPQREQTPTLQWWDRTRALLEVELEKRTEAVTLDTQDAELTTMYSIRASLSRRGVAEFEDGRILRLLSPESEDSWFSGAIQERVE